MNGIIQFIVNHQVIMAGVFIAILDFIFAMNKNLESNGILHGIYVFFKNIVSGGAKPEVK